MKLNRMVGAAALTLVLLAGTANAQTTNVVTVTDFFGRQVKVDTPVKRVAVTERGLAEAMRSLGLTDRFVGVAQNMANNKFWPNMTTPVVASNSEVNFEKLAEVRPQLVISSAESHGVITDDEHLKGFEMGDIKLSFRHAERLADEVTLLGKLFGVPERAAEYNAWVAKYQTLITSRIADVKEENRPLVFLEGHPANFTTGGPGSFWYQQVVSAGGRSLAAGMKGDAQVSDEWVAARNPEFYIREADAGLLSYNVASDAKAKQAYDEIVNRPALKVTNAVKKNQVHLVSLDIYSRPAMIVGIAYMAKWFYPDRFTDLNPDAMLREYYEKFQKVAYAGTWTYPAAQ